jgi:hypothetical protein
MITAKITRKEGYRCAPNGAVVVAFAFGDTVTGKVAELALEDGAAQELHDPRTDVQAMTPPETKATRSVSRKRKA